MTGKKLCLGTFILVFGVIIIGNLAAQTDRNLNGTWVCNEYESQREFMLNNGNFEMSDVRRDVSSFLRGTFTANNGILTIRTTHTMWLGGDIEKFGLVSGRWYTYDEQLNATKNFLLKEGMPENEINEYIKTSSSLSQCTYSIVSSSLILTDTHTFNGETFTNTCVYTRK